ncbi:MAG: hypothetical protein KIS67_13170 [Verrucomicrobiae bacterium]|nr:hypothetical protein [Verrucomicrobiae bacterium]
MRIVAIILSLWTGGWVSAQTGDWPRELQPMPLGSGVRELNRTNCVPLMLNAFQSNPIVKALIFMPGATDELYFFRRVKVPLTNESPSLLDAVVALTNHSPLRATFRPPFLLLHSEEDVLDLIVEVQHPPTVAKLQQRGPLPHWLFHDRDWDQLLSSIRKPVRTGLRPYARSMDSWDFYRHSFAAWNLTAWETLEAAALAGKTRISVRRGVVEFQLDQRIGVLPKLDRYPQ